MPHNFDDLKKVGNPLKELFNNSDSGFQDLSSIKDILTPLKELSKNDSFDELSSLKEGFAPLKDLNPGPKPGDKPGHGKDVIK